MHYFTSLSCLTCRTNLTRGLQRRSFAVPGVAGAALWWSLPLHCDMEEICGIVTEKYKKKTSLLWNACKPFLRVHWDENKETVQHITGCRNYLKPCSRIRLRTGTFSRWGNAPQGGTEAPTSNVLLCDLISSWWVGTSPLNARFSPLLGDGSLIKFMKLLSLGTRQINKPTLFRPNSSSSEEKKKKRNKNLDWKGFDALCGS